MGGVGMKAEFCFLEVRLNEVLNNLLGKLTGK